MPRLHYLFRQCPLSTRRQYLRRLQISAAAEALAMADRDQHARRMIEAGEPSPAWGEAAAAVKELLEMRGGPIE